LSQKEGATEEGRPKKGYISGRLAARKVSTLLPIERGKRVVPNLKRKKKIRWGASKKKSSHMVGSRGADRILILGEEGKPTSMRERRPHLHLKKEPKGGKRGGSMGRSQKMSSNKVAHGGGPWGKMKGRENVGDVPLILKRRRKSVPEGGEKNQLSENKKVLSPIVALGGRYGTKMPANKKPYMLFWKKKKEELPERGKKVRETRKGSQRHM